jgi:hypothetical protein
MVNVQLTYLIFVYVHKFTNLVPQKTKLALPPKF